MSLAQEADEGSSPHTRGARIIALAGVVWKRIIPAYAGSTPLSGALARPSRDHPRIRGEHARGLPYAFWRLGSSPHTRGAHTRRCDRGDPSGIIPAYAGSTFEGSGRRLALEGSSPHTRGAQDCGHLRQHVRGIIPAYAGSTWPPCGIRAACRDHPRIRGEHLKLGRGVVVSGGSSPHTRGAHRPMRTERPGSGIIPAYAGSTGRRCGRLSRSPDHPRIRGEHLEGENYVSHGTGSSPHTRGARVIVEESVEICGIIPAYAGSTKTSTRRA